MLYYICRLNLEMKTMKQLFLFLFFILTGSGVFAQQDSLIQRSFHLSLITPLSTNGFESYKTVNDFSLSLFYSGSAGVSGLEVGAFLNYTHYYVNGAQLAGFMNIVRKRVVGLQGAGFVNTTLGVQDGIQVAGFANYSKELQGIQISGFTNISGATKGIQLAGFSNVASHVKGMQISGFANIAGSLRGMQLGFINIVDSLDRGLPIGFLSIVGRGGYHRMDLWTDELIHTNLAYKVGVPAFYNIFGVGANLGDTPFQWVYTYGVGSEIPLGRNWNLMPEILAQSIDRKGYLRDQDNWNTIFQLRTLINYQIIDGWGIYFGPSVKMLIQEGDTSFFPSTLQKLVIDKNKGDMQRIYWVGFTLGMKLF